MEESYSYGGDDKWKLSKKGRSRSGRAHQHTMDADAGENNMLSRSYSASVSSTRIPMRGQHQQAHAHAHSPHQQASQGTTAGLSKKCVEAVKEHRARFYIVRRCVSMLVCWRDH